MRKYAFFLLFPLTCFMHAQTPITVSESDIVSAGNEYIFSDASPAITFDASETGPDFTWDYSSLTPLLQDTDVWVHPNETDAAYFLLWFTSDVANATGQNIDLTVISFEDIYNFYERTSSQFAITGTAGTISGVPLPAIFDNADVIYKFPVDYGNVDSSTASYSIEIPGVGGWSEERHRTNTVDGWGQLTTPYGTFDVLRIKSDLQADDVISTTGGDFPFSYLTHEYRWVGKLQGIPLLQITTQDLFGFETVSRVTYRDSLRITAIQENKSLHAFTIFPDPADDILHVSMNQFVPGKIYLTISDAEGKVVMREDDAFTENNFNIHISSLPSGIYSLEVRTAESRGIQFFIKR